jgi:hypothetical protein
VAIAAEADEPGTGRIRMQAIEDASAASLRAFIQDCVESESVLHTDGALPAHTKPSPGSSELLFGAMQAHAFREGRSGIAKFHLG